MPRSPGSPTAGDAAARELLTLAAPRVQPGLTRVRELLRAFDDPQSGLRAVHIAGTNGKGSVAAMLTSILCAAGLRAGCYTSPHLVDVRERIRVDGRCVDEAPLRRLAQTLKATALAMRERPSYFEMMTALALAYFADVGVDVAVVEAGMGGRFDATNVVDPLVCAITNIATDHTDYLGSAPEEIAWEKAGIAKRGVPVVVGEQIRGEPLEVISREVARCGARLVASRADTARHLGGDWTGSSFRVTASSYTGHVRLALPGRFQTTNVGVALTVVDALREQGIDVPSEAVALGLSHARWPGRLETVREAPRVVLDGAHNVAGARALVEALDDLGPPASRRRLLLGVLGDKDAAGMLRILLPAFAHATMTASRSPRAMAAPRLAEIARGVGVEVGVADTVRDGLQSVVGGSADDELVTVAGSLTVVGEARAYLVGGPCDDEAA